MREDETAETGLSAEEYRELGKVKIQSSDKNIRSEGFKCIITASRMGDLDACSIFAQLILGGYLRPKEGDPEEYALEILSKTAKKGCLNARAALNRHCMKKYCSSNSPVVREPEPLVDFEGRAITVNRQGALTPIDAVLEYKDGCNQLTLSTNLLFVNLSDAVEDPEKFMTAVAMGIKGWSGTYYVFGNQKLRVTVKITFENRLIDNIYIVAADDVYIMKEKQRAMKRGGESAANWDNSSFAKKRAFMQNVNFSSGWSVKSRKYIFLFSESGKFNEYAELSAIAKHEFGHALGLGDLYMNEKDGLAGVDKGTFKELDSYYVKDNYYNLVMCDHNGPVGNNDIEMVLLAFRDNEKQLYQPSKTDKKISDALGKGN